MKKLLLIFLIPISCLGQWMSPTSYKGGVATGGSSGGGTGSTVLNPVMIQTMEFDTLAVWDGSGRVPAKNVDNTLKTEVLSPTHLAGSDNTSVGSWLTPSTENWYGVMAETGTTYERGSPPISGFTDTGTRGLGIENGSDYCNISYTLPTAKNDIVCAMWYRTTHVGYAYDMLQFPSDGPYFFGADDGTGNAGDTVNPYNGTAIWFIQDGRDAVEDRAFKLGARLAPDYAYIPLTEETWYWIVVHWDYTKGVKFSVYDVGGNHVPGSPVFIARTTQNNDDRSIKRLWFGNTTIGDHVPFWEEGMVMSGHEATRDRWNMSYFDDVCIGSPTIPISEASAPVPVDLPNFVPEQ